MDKKRKICLVIGILISILTIYSNDLFAQQYKRSAGVRLGGTSGVTFKNFIVEEESIEFIVSGRHGGVQLSGLYLFHQPMQISFNENFYFYYGVGGHIGVEKFSDYHKVISNEDPNTFIYEEADYFTIGVDAMAGVEYRLLSVPVTFGLDFKPYVNFIGLRHLKANFWDTSISIKYIF